MGCAHCRGEGLARPECEFGLRLALSLIEATPIPDRASVQPPDIPWLRCLYGDRKPLRHCTRRAHDRLESRAVAGQSYRSIIGAMHNRCDKLFIRRKLWWFSRSSALLERRIILSPRENDRLRSIALSHSQIGKSNSPEWAASAHVAHTRRPSRAHSHPSAHKNNRACP